METDERCESAPICGATHEGRHHLRLTFKCSKSGELQRLHRFIEQNLKQTEAWRGMHAFGVMSHMRRYCFCSTEGRPVYDGDNVHPPDCDEAIAVAETHST